MGVTMASSAPASALSSELLPALGWPAIALAGFAQHRVQCCLQTFQLALCIGLLQKVDLFFREVQRGLDQHAQVNQRIAQHMDFFGEITRQRTAGAAGCSLGAGIDQVGNRFGLRQVDLVVQKSALRKLARLRHAQTGQARLAGGRVVLGRRLQAARHQQLQNHRATVCLQLQHVFARERVWGHKMQRQAMVDGAAIGIGKGQIRGLARLERATAQGLNQGVQIAA
jgi:hypothetical protein